MKNKFFWLNLGHIVLYLAMYFLIIFHHKGLPIKEMVLIAILLSWFTFISWYGGRTTCPLRIMAHFSPSNWLRAFKAVYGKKFLQATIMYVGYYIYLLIVCPIVLYLT